MSKEPSEHTHVSGYQRALLRIRDIATQMDGPTKDVSDSARLARIAIIADGAARPRPPA